MCSYLLLVNYLGVALALALRKVYLSALLTV
jgi:hypothetical protein